MGFQAKASQYLLPGLAMDKIYSNSMLALLNNRAVIEGGRRARDAFDEVWTTALEERQASLEEHAMNIIRNRHPPDCRSSNETPSP
jgi:hypothetical protein